MKAKDKIQLILNGGEPIVKYYLRPKGSEPNWKPEPIENTIQLIFENKNEIDRYKSFTKKYNRIYQSSGRNHSKALESLSIDELKYMTALSEKGRKVSFESPDD